MNELLVNNNYLGSNGHLIWQILESTITLSTCMQSAAIVLLRFTSSCFTASDTWWPDQCAILYRLAALQPLYCDQIVACCTASAGLWISTTKNCY